MINKYFIINKYAESLFEASIESQQLVAVSDDLNLISELFDDEFTKMLRIMQSSEAAVERLKNSRHYAQMSDIVKNFFNVLIENKRIVLADDIINEFFELKHRYEKCEKIIIETAKELHENDKSEIRKLLTGMSQSKLYFDFNVDPELIYGIRIIYKAKVLDFSLQGMLDDLKFSEV